MNTGCVLGLTGITNHTANNISISVQRGIFDFTVSNFTSGNNYTLNIPIAKVDPNKSILNIVSINHDDDSSTTLIFIKSAYQFQLTSNGESIQIMDRSKKHWPTGSGTQLSISWEVITFP